jgi:hypothetical protein
MEPITETLKPFPDPKTAHNEALDDTGSMWDHFVPREVSFFKMTLLDWLRHRPYHVVTLQGPLNLKQLTEDYRDQTFRSERIIDRSGNLITTRLLLRLGGEVFGYLEGESFQLYAPTAESVQTAAKEFRRYVKSQSAGKPRFYIISIEDDGPRTETVTIERPAPVTTEELALNYGEDFPAWERGWTERMQSTPSGLTILHGPPGCGKTSYLRALMAGLIDRAVFYYVPVSEVEMLSSPRFVGFWIEQARRHRKKHKIAIVEDAEELLLPRDAGNRDKVSNLLNIGDGFLGEHLKLHVIATTNSPVRQLDPALLRPGRLMGTREFRRLSRPEAQRLAKAKGLSLPDQQDYSLAEVYCGPISGSVLNADRQIGFALGDMGHAAFVSIFACGNLVWKTVNL